MTAVWTALLSISFVLIAANLLFAILELTTVRTVHPPKRQSFATVRASEEQFQTIMAPAVGALASGLLVSISASFFYSSLVGDGGNAHRIAGLGVFFAAGLSLALTIGMALKRGVQAAEIARNPFTIRAAAEEYANDPRRAPVGPETLSQNLEIWTQYRSARSFNLELNAEAPKLDATLDSTICSRGFWSALLDSLAVFLFAVARFPFRFGWPIIGHILLPTSIIGIVITGETLAPSAAPRLLTMFALTMCLSTFSVLFYGTARGNRARLWHRVNHSGKLEAQSAIVKAAAIQDEIRTQEDLQKRVLEEADRLLSNSAADGPPQNAFTFSFGRIRLEFSRKASSRR